MRDRSDVVALVVVGLLGIAAAAVCFGLLRSEARAETGLSLSGAIVGCLLAWSALGSLYLNLRRDTHAYVELQRQNRELTDKLVRSAPRPLGFELEVDDNQRIVLARPQTWERGGGTIFDYQLSSEHMAADDIFPARFVLRFTPLPAGVGPEDCYAEMKSLYDTYLSALGASYTSEVVQIGGADGVPALKFSAQAYARVALAGDERPGAARGEWEYVNRAEFEKKVNWLVDRAITRRLIVNLDTAERLARAKAVLVPEVARALEKRELDPREQGIRSYVDALLDAHGEAFFGDAFQRNGDDAAPSAVSSAAGQGVTELKPASSNGAGDAAPVEPGEREAVVPIGRMIVVCCHPGIHKVYTFDFVDNASEYARASEIFNRVLDSVRFLV